MKTVTLKTSELEGAALDWAVGYAVHGEDMPASRGWKFGEDWLIPDCEDYGSLDGPYSPSIDWAQGGTLIKKHRVGVGPSTFCWLASVDACVASSDSSYTGPTPLIAAMRAIVASVLGDTVDIPEELAQ